MDILANQSGRSYLLLSKKQKPKWTQ